MSNLFARLDEHAIAAKLHSGGMLFRHGDPVSGAYTIRSGKVALIWISNEGLSPMDTLGPGAILGLPAVLNGEYSLSARALVDCEVGFLPASRVLDMLATDHGMLQEVTKLLASEVARMRDLARNRTTQI
ncbi:MAG TPA: cyclic nucleotide-binding domain-containing protein [Acidobacteriaceae bacterium]|jgi:CRP-like cAMP-binding protein|nr:cyclic nucleotide-binding domain-containing protein [Acidobacteriaceae bacterium]